MEWYERWTCISCVVRNTEAFFVISQLEWGVRKYIGPNDLDFILLFQLQIYKIQDSNKVLKHCMEEILGVISKDSKLSNLSMKWLMEWWWVIDGMVNDWWSGGKWLMEWWMIDGVVVKWFVEWWWWLMEWWRKNWWSDDEKSWWSAEMPKLSKLFRRFGTVCHMIYSTLVWRHISYDIGSLKMPPGRTEDPEWTVLNRRR